MPRVATFLDNAIANLQNIVQLCSTDYPIKSAPDYPIENADPFPMSVAYIGSSRIRFTNASTTHIFPTIILEIHFSRVNIKDTYQAINNMTQELPRRLAADPTLGGTVSTIIATADQELESEVGPFDWGNVKSQMLKFTIPVKSLQNPITT